MAKHRSGAWRTAVTYGVAFGNGAVIMAFEMLGVRAIQPDFGSSIEVWASVIGVVLKGVPFGRGEEERLTLERSNVPNSVPLSLDLGVLNG